MAPRRTFVATLTTPDRRPIATVTRYAWNAAIRASEDAMRAHAREAGEVFTASAPEVDGKRDDPNRSYQRVWTGNGTGDLVYVDISEVCA